MEGNNFNQESKENILSHWKDLIMKVDHGRDVIRTYSSDTEMWDHQHKVEEIIAGIVETALISVHFLKLPDQNVSI